MLAKEAFTCFQNMEENIVKDIAWTLDGSKLVSSSEDQNIRIFLLSEDNKILEYPEKVTRDAQEELEISELKLFREFKEGNYINDMNTYNSSGLNTQNYVLTATKANPVHLWSIRDSCISQQYISKNYVDELSTPYSLTSNELMEVIAVGYERYFAIFDLQYSKEISRAFIKQDKKVQKTIISSVSISRQSPHIMGAGCFNGNIYICDIRDKHPIQQLLPHPVGGITCTQFMSSEMFLFSSARNENAIFSWDLRKDMAYVNRTYLRNTNTNQRIKFDIDPRESRMASGNIDGSITCFDLNENKCELQYPGHFDCISSCKFNPWTPEILATCSGQRHFNLELEGTRNNIEGTMNQFGEEESAYSITTNIEEYNLHKNWLHGIRIWILPSNSKI